jgi:hypothetical protein
MITMDAPELLFDLIELDRTKRNERELNDLIFGSLGADDCLDAEELIELYLSVVRSRNKLRRNWHPKKSRQCDLNALHWICTKNQARSAISKSLQEALTVLSDGTEVIHKDKLKEIEEKIINGISLNSRKTKTKLSPLETIVMEALKSNPHATQNEVIQEIKNDPNRFGVVAIDEEDGIISIEIKTKSEKSNTTAQRSLRSIGNTLTKIRNR